ncbi:MAG: hypothetical protein AAFY36_17400 [Bacteroidota bacterium]
MHILLRSLLVFTTLGLFIACGASADATTSNTEAVVDEPEATTDTSAELPELYDPCAMNIEDVIAAFGWSGGTGPFPNQMNREDFQSCDYVGDGQDGRLTIQTKRMGAEATYKKYLELNFQAALNNTSGSMTWRSVDGLGDQAIYGYGQNGPNQVYRLEYRLGNHTSINLSHMGSLERDPESTLTALTALASKF